MKALRYIVLAFAAIFIAASCVVEDQTMTVEYNVSSVQTKASEEVDANYVWYALYDLNGRLMRDYGIKPIVDGNANCPVEMIKGQSYNVVFVAQHYCPAENDVMLPSYQINPAQARVLMPASAGANSDNYDLFKGLDMVVEYNGQRPDKVILKRIVSQVNVMAVQDEWNAAKSNGTLPDASEIKLTGVPAAYDLLTGTVADEKITVNYRKAGLMGDDFLLGRAYCLPSDNIEMTIGLYDGDSKVNELTISRLYVEENKKSNITGMSLTE